MAHPEHFDTLILGSGQGGKLLAWHLGRSGQRVAVVERQWVGGSCPAVACLPTKNEIWSAQHAGDFGTQTGPVSTDLSKVLQRKRDMVQREVEAHLRFYQSSGAELVMGSGRLVAPKTIEVTLNQGGTRTLTGTQLVINVGSHAAIPDIAGLAAAKPLTHIEALEINQQPAHLIVLGGGYIGIELAQAFRRFGSRVTIVDHNPQLMHREDPDIAAEVLRILRGEQTLEGSHLLVAAGRIPNTAGIGLDQAGIELDERGFVRVNEKLQTSAPDSWAIGECAGSPQFTHVSVDDFRIVRDNMAGGSRSTQERLVPYCMFTDPPLAHVGLNEREAARQQIAVRVAKLPMSHVLRGQATDETLGFMKVLVAADDDRILGFTMLGAEAGEVMAAMQTAMLAELPYTKLRDAVISHLTYAEGLGPLLGNVPARSVQ
jgi:pyruvate/2-oxoglutarate dehydrogenase complex dihydrolipoamide dehydrogenase (E3) component